MADGPKEGVRAALDALGGAEIAQAKACERAVLPSQRDFFQPEPDAGAATGEDSDEAARLDGALPLGVSRAASRGPGRPAGARNRRTAAVAEYLVRRYGDPLEGAVSIGMRPLRELIEDLKAIAEAEGLPLGGSVMEIARFQAACREAALPYLHAKRAPEDDKGTPVTPVFAFVERGSAPAPQGRGGRSIDDAPVIDVTPQRNQGLSEGAGLSSDSTASDADE